MIKVFPIDFIREIIVNTLWQEKTKNANLFGGDNEIYLESFYSQLKRDGEVDRFVRTFDELADQQNRKGLIGSGVILAPENPTITNLYSAMIIPMSYTCSIRCTYEDRDTMIDTINNLIECLKGRKVDIAQLRCQTDEGVCYYLFVVGTIGEDLYDNKPTILEGDFLGAISSANETLSTKLNAIITSLAAKNVDTTGVGVSEHLFYYEDSGILKVAYATKVGVNIAWQEIVDANLYKDFAFPPEHDSFEKYKVSLSFDSLRCDTPRTLNAQDYVEISFGGSATLVNNGVLFGNDLVKVSFKKKLIKASTDITPNDSTVYFLEPLEMPSGNSADTFANKLLSNKMISNSQTDGLALSLQYTFIADMNISLLKQFFNYARYGTQATSGAYISPNLIFEVCEYWSSWGNFEKNTFNAKVIESIDIENTESDTLTISIPLQIQGENN